MRNKINYISSFKILLTIIFAFLFVSYVISHTIFYTISPDSVRFMHFWQINFDHLKSSGFTISNVIKFIYFSLKSSTIYDINRGRYLQYIIYGIDGLTRSSTPNALMNYIMIILIMINSLLISKIVTNDIKEVKDRVNIFCLTFLFIITLSYSYSPIILLNLYGKYFFATFILAYFSTNKNSYKILWLSCSALTDELGFLATLIIIFFTFLKKVLAFYEINNTNITVKKILKNSFIISLALTLLLFFAYYGMSSTLFNVGSGFASLAYGFAGESINGGISNVFLGLGWLSGNLITGFYINSVYITILASLLIYMSISLNVKNIITPYLKVSNKKISSILLHLLNNKDVFFYITWILLFIFINLLIIPGGVNDFTHRSYPRFLTVTMLFLYSFLKFKNKKILYIFFISTISFHILSINKSIKSTSKSLENYLLPDRSVNIYDLNILRASILDLNSNINSDKFDKINNFEEIDFSGTWYYSRNKNFDTTYKMHYPIEGTVRVLTWPHVIKTKKSKREFDYKRPSFKSFND